MRAAAGAVSSASAAGTSSVGPGQSASAGMTAGSVAPSAGGFPRTGEEINIKAKGPYKVANYTEGLVASEYASAVMYYPEDATPPFAAVALSPGFTAYGTDYEFVGDMLASHGIAALLTTPTTTADQPPQRGEDLVAAVQHLQEENTREGSPLKGKIATDRLGITGHSMGGGGSLFGANSLGNKIRCVVPMEPWQPGGSFRMVAAPTMIIGAASDAIASVSGNAQGHYSSIPDSVEKFLVVFEGDHYLSTDRTSGIPQSEHAVANEKYDPQAAYMIPFYKLFLEDDERYKPYLYGAERSTTIVTDYQASKM
jgi:predicted dienelactone hydrolase